MEIWRYFMMPKLDSHEQSSSQPIVTHFQVEADGEISIPTALSKAEKQKRLRERRRLLWRITWVGLTSTAVFVLAVRLFDIDYRIGVRWGGMPTRAPINRSVDSASTPPTHTPYITQRGNPAGEIALPDWSIYNTYNQSRIEIRRLLGAQDKAFADDFNSVEHYSWSSDGNSLLIGLKSEYMPDNIGVMKRLFTPYVILYDLLESSFRRIYLEYGYKTPELSPNKEFIAYTHIRSDNTGDIFRVRTNDTDIQPVVATGFDEIHPVWAPDGRSIYFFSDQDGIRDIYRVSIDDGTVTRITFTPEEEEQSFRISTDGAYLILRQKDRFQRISLQAAEPPHEINLQGEIPHGLGSTFTLSADGRSLLVFSYDVLLRIDIYTGTVSTASDKVTSDLGIRVPSPLWR